MGIFGVTDQAGHEQAAFNLVFVADNADNGYPFARPLVFFEHFVAVGLAPHDFAALDVTGLERLKAHSLELLIFTAVIERRHVVGVQV